MMKSVITVSLTCLLLICGKDADLVNSEKDAPRQTAFVNVNVVSITSEDVLRNQTVLVADGRIKSILDSKQAKLPEGTEVIDAKGKYLMPGLADMHVHIRDETELLSYLVHGVTTVLNMRGTRETLELRRHIETGKVLGPNIFTTGPLVDGDPPSWSGSGTHVVTSDTEAVKAVNDTKSAGYDFIKVYNGLKPDPFAALMRAAKQQEMAVIGHIPREAGAVKSLDSGLAMIAHSEEFFFTHFDAPRDLRTDEIDRYEPDYKQIPFIAEKVRATGAAVTPNLSFVRMTSIQLKDYAAVEGDPEFQFLTNDVRDMWRRSNPNNRPDLVRFKRREAIKYPLVQALTKGFADAGVLLLLGTDSSAPGMFPGRSAHLELRELVAAGLTPHEALSTATINANKFIRAHVPESEAFGTITPGSKADLLLLVRNPLEDITAIEEISGVMLAGRWFTVRALGQMRRQMRTSRSH